LVEDEAEIRRFVRTALEAEGWSVRESTTLREGVIDAGTEKPDLAILDLGLPDGDGKEFITQVRAWSGLPIIVLSARVDETDKVLTHRHILREVWGPSHVDHHHYARVYMGHLRQKLEDDPARPRHLLTETAIGYRLLA